MEHGQPRHVRPRASGRAVNVLLLRCALEELALQVGVPVVPVRSQASPRESSSRLGSRAALPPVPRRDDRSRVRLAPREEGQAVILAWSDAELALIIGAILAAGGLGLYVGWVIGRAG